ncbi:MAG: hypothetical protein AAFP86_21985, partial [Planctomycetota bacterium]
NVEPGVQEALFEEVPAGLYELNSATLVEGELRLSSQPFEAVGGLVELAERNGRGSFQVDLVDTEGWELLSVLSRGSVNGRTQSSTVHIRLDLEDRLRIGGIRFPDAEVFVRPIGDTYEFPSFLKIDLSTQFEASLAGLE